MFRRVYRSDHRSPPSRSRRRAATVVEMAVVAPVVFLLIFAVIEFSRMVMLQQALVNAAREGCRKATLASTTSASDVDAVVRNYLEGTIRNASSTSVVTVTVSPSTLAGMDSETDITTTVQVNYNDVSWAPASFLGNVTLQGKSTMRRE